MKISEQWLRTWVDPQIDSDTLADQLTMAGLEVDDTSPVAPAFTGVVVGEVVEVAPHPDADRLRVTKVNVCADNADNGGAKELLQIVCGAPNVAVGMKAPVATIGAVLPNDFKIKKSKLRGVESQGMLCGASELGLVDKIDGLLALEADAPIGQDIREYLNLDARIIDVSITPNRGDCFSVRGLARELAVINALNFADPSIKAAPTVGAPSTPVTSQTDDCPRYLVQLITGVNGATKSPSWLVAHLERSGLQSRNLLVDVTNYVLMYLGQPLHAFDADKIQGNIVVRHAKVGETLILLDEQEITLAGDELVIADDSGVIALAGIMGGLSTSITDATQNVLLESAHFTPLAMAGRARRFGLHTDASQRFERGVDYELPETALNLAVGLIVKCAGGQVHEVSCAENLAALPAKTVVEVSGRQISQRLGVDIAKDTITDIFTRLGFVVKPTACEENGTRWRCTVPSYRFDVAIKDDLIEEVARIYGYDNLPAARPSLEMALKPKPDAVTSNQVAHLLASFGYLEAVSFSFSDAKLEALLQPESKPLPLANPISADLAVMRSSLLSSLLPCVQHNLNRQQTSVRFFEFGLRFEPAADGEIANLAQIPTLALVATGERYEKNWTQSSHPLDFYDIKHHVAQVFELASGIQADLTYVPSTRPFLHPGQSADVLLGGVLVGYVGVLHPSVVQALDLPKAQPAVLVAELDVSAVLAVKTLRAEPLPRFPSVRRDLAMVVADDVPVGELLASIQHTAKQTQECASWLKDAWVFDVYQGANIDKGSKSIAIATVWQDADKTLEDAPMQEVIHNIVNELKNKFNAQLRES